jgi:hypothetical protein
LTEEENPFMVREIVILKALVGARRLSMVDCKQSGKNIADWHGQRCMKLKWVKKEGAVGTFGTGDGSHG